MRLTASVGARNGRCPGRRGMLVAWVVLACALTASAGSSVAAASGGPASASAVSPASAQQSSPGRLVVSGANILDPAGQPIILRGFNWGQWGTVQPQDAADNIAQGANSVRIPLRWWGTWKNGVDSYDPNAPKHGYIDRAHLALLDRTIGWATSHHLWVILFADSNNGQGANKQSGNFWTDPTMKQRFEQMWQFLARRYASTPYIGAYELLAEPRPPKVSDSAVRDFYDSLISVVRRVDKRTPVVVGPNDGYNLHHLTAAYTSADPDVIYTGDYFIFGNPLSRIHLITAFEKQFDAPVWINQVGIPSGKPGSKASARSVLGALDSNGIGWAWWTYRDSGTSPDGEGIWYRNPADPSQWILKSQWLSLVSGYFRATTSP